MQWQLNFVPDRSRWSRGFRTLAAFLVLAVVAIGAVVSSSAASESPQSSRPKLILFLTADGFRTDYIDWYNPPNLKHLIDEGVRVKHATNVFPTLTTPNMTALVCGAYPRTTGVAGNSQYMKELDRVVEKPRDNKAITIGEMLSRAGWKTAAVNHFMLETRGAQIYRDTDYDDSEGTTDEILKILREDHPQFIAAIYGAADHAGHRFGPHSEQVKNAVLGIDTAVGRLLKGLRDLGIYDQTAIAFTADHGMSGFDEKPVSMEPAKALEKAGFKVVTAPKAFKPDTQVVVINGGVRMIYFRANVSAKQKQQAIECLRQIKGAEVLGRAELDALGCHNNRSGDLIVSPLPGYTISHAGDVGGEHGRFAERNPVMFFHGFGFAKGKLIEGANNVDVTPTLLHLAGVAPARTVEGRVLKEVLAN